jgi:hypothetical protein
MGASWQPLQDYVNSNKAPFRLGVRAKKFWANNGKFEHFLSLWLQVWQQIINKILFVWGPMGLGQTQFFFQFCDVTKVAIISKVI